MTAPAMVIVGYSLPGAFRDVTQGNLASTFLFVPSARDPRDDHDLSPGIGYEVRLVGEARERASVGHASALTPPRDTWYVYVSSSEFVTTYYALAQRADLDVFGLLTTINGVGAVKAGKLLDAVPPEQVARCAADGQFSVLAKLAKGTGFGPKMCAALCDGKTREMAADLIAHYWPGDDESRAGQALRREVERSLSSLGLTEIECARYLDAVPWDERAASGVTAAFVVREVLRSRGR